MSTRPTRRETTHDRIVDVAARTLRRSGYAGVGVADVMKQAGLTHGGFYAHFESRDALLAEAIERAGRDSAANISRRIDAARTRGHSALRGLVEGYLSDEHLSAAETGCVVAATSSEMPRQSAALRALSSARVNNLIAMVKQALPKGGSQEQADGHRRHHGRRTATGAHGGPQRPRQSAPRRGPQVPAGTTRHRITSPDRAAMRTRSSWIQI